MIRIAGITIDEKKHIKFALTPIKGVGKSNVLTILKEFKLVGNEKLSDLEEQDVVKLRNYIETTFLVEADLRRKNQADIKRLIDIGTYRGSRHKNALPTRGQRTRTNSRTRRGNVRRTAGSGRIKSADKT
jgi:small subunit ribosomal protein S13